MKLVTPLIAITISTLLSGCVVIKHSTPSKNAQDTTSENIKTTPTSSAKPLIANACIGSISPPAEYADKLKVVHDKPLLANALGEPTKGGLCQGKVYEVTESFTIYRAWNSTNPNSKFGKWWAFYEPSGARSEYREDYEICYQWSPIDMMTQCQISPGTKVVIGTGQSAFCSQYLTYPVSDAQQIYFENADESTMNCNNFHGVFNWQPVATEM